MKIRNLLATGLLSFGLVLTLASCNSANDNTDTTKPSVTEPSVKPGTTPSVPGENTETGTTVPSTDPETKPSEPEGEPDIDTPTPNPDPNPSEPDVDNPTPTPTPDPEPKPNPNPNPVDPDVENPTPTPTPTPNPNPEEPDIDIPTPNPDPDPNPNPGEPDIEVPTPTPTPNPNPNPGEPDINVPAPNPDPSEPEVEVPSYIIKGPNEIVLNDYDINTLEELKLFCLNNYVLFDSDFNTVNEELILNFDPADLDLSKTEKQTLVIKITTKTITEPITFNVTVYRKIIEAPTILSIDFSGVKKKYEYGEKISGTFVATLEGGYTETIEINDAIKFQGYDATKPGTQEVFLVIAGNVYPQSFTVTVKPQN